MKTYFLAFSLALGSPALAAPPPHPQGVSAAAPTSLPPGITINVSPPPAPKAEAKDDSKGFWDGGGAILLGALPALIWSLVIVFAVLRLFPQIVDLLKRLKAFRGLGLELEFQTDEKLDAAAQSQNVGVDAGLREALHARLALTGETLKGMVILWVDDEPNNNINEISLLASLGVRVRTVRTTSEALAAIPGLNPALILANMERPADPRPGLDLLADLGTAGVALPTVIYCATDQTGRTRPAGLFGITNRPDELMHLVLDVRERQIR